MTVVFVALLALTTAVLAALVGYMVARQREDAQRWNTFLDATGHELRTPLTAIMGYQELLEDGVYGQLNQRGQEAVGRIGAAARELLSLLNGMVDMSRPEALAPDLDIEPVDLNGLLQEAAETGRRLGPERNVTWSDDLPDRLPVLHSDPNRLQRALFLAVLACVRATPGGALHLSARADGDGAVVELHGVGFSTLPEPPIQNVVRDGGEAEEERSLLRLLIAIDSIGKLGGSASLDEADRDRAGTLRLRLADIDAP